MYSEKYEKIARDIYHEEKLVKLRKLKEMKINLRYTPEELLKTIQNIKHEPLHAVRPGFHGIKCESYRTLLTTSVF